MKWYKHDPSAALAGMIGLTIEERGAYYTLIDLQYARAPHSHGDVTDELVISALATRPQVWRRLKAGLIAKGKVREIEGKLTANRVETQVKLVMIKGGFRGQIGENQGLSSLESKEAKEAKERKKESASRSPKKARARRARSLFPEGWRSADLPPDQQGDFDAFADHARTHARTCADWEAAWRTWHRKSVRMQQQERPNGRSLLAAIDGTIDFLGGEEAARRYVPGSEGPRPLNLDRVESPPRVRRLSSR